METRFAKIESDLSGVKVDVATILSNYSTKSDIESVRGDIHKSAGETYKWMIATVIGLFVGFGGLFLAMSNALKPSSPAIPQAPMIITLPAPMQPATPALAPGDSAPGKPPLSK